MKNNDLIHKIVSIKSELKSLEMLHNLKVSDIKILIKELEDLIFENRSEDISTDTSITD